MTRTQRRHAARVAHLHRLNLAPHLSPASPQPLSDAEWLEIAETLDGIFHVDFPSPFTDLELLCPKEAWLVVDLTRARANATAPPSLRHTISGVIDALARLLVSAETLRPWPDLYKAFWARVLTSDMTHNRLEIQSDPWLRRGVVRYMRARGTHIAFQWRGRRLEPTQVIEPLRKCLETTTVGIQRNHQHTPVRVALRFEDCQLTSKTLASIYSLLTIPTAPIGTGKTRLFESATLRELSLSSNVLHAHILWDLAHCLQHPSSRRIDGLRLDSTVPEQIHQTPAYTTAFRQLIATAVAMRPGATLEADPGLTLSLEDCTIFRAGHIDALANALLEAARPLRALSCACWHLPDATALDRFARFLLAPLPTATSEFDLDVSCIHGPGEVNDVEVAIQDARLALLEAALPRIMAALTAGRRVSCRLTCFAFATEDEDLTNAVEWEVSSIRYYDVRHITEDQHVQIEGEDGSGWTNWWTIANICIDGACVLRCAPSGLIVDRCRRRAAGHTLGGRVVLELAGVTGSQVTRLSMRDNQWNWQQYASWCPLLEELNAEGDSYDGYEFWSDKDDPVAGESLQVINVAKCKVDTEALRKFLSFPNVRSLRLDESKISFHGLETLYDKLQTNPGLEFVDIRHAGFNPDKQTCAFVRVNIDWLLQLERAGTETRVAFSLALRHLETKIGLEGDLSGDVCTYILSFLDTRARRVVVW